MQAVITFIRVAHLSSPARLQDAAPSDDKDDNERNRRPDDGADLDIRQSRPVAGATVYVGIRLNLIARLSRWTTPKRNNSGKGRGQFEDGLSDYVRLFSQLQGWCRETGNDRHVA